MDFTEWMICQGYSDEQIGEILFFFRKLPASADTPVKVAAKFLLEKTDIINPRKEKRNKRKIEVGQIYSAMSKKYPATNKAYKVRRIAEHFNVKPDCIYTYLRELRL